MPVTREQVLSALRSVQDPELFKDIVTLNMVKAMRFLCMPNSPRLLAR
jgi:metal-sulfur cluster biosynthetic enzyme